MCIYHIDLQSVADEMVREISLEVRERSGNFFKTFGQNCVASPQ